MMAAVSGNANAVKMVLARGANVNARESAYGQTALMFSAALFLNVFAGVYLACRKLFLKDTGRKLVHLEKQLRSGTSIAEELSRYLED